MSPLPRAELQGQLRSYLTSDIHPPDIHFKCDLCPLQAEEFVERKVWEGGNQVINEKHIVEVIVNKDGSRRFVVLIPVCSHHRNRFSRDVKVEYDVGRGKLWRYFRKQITERVMED